MWTRKYQILQSERYLHSLRHIVRSYTIIPLFNFRGGQMANLDEALQQLREEREQAQFRVEKLYEAISTIESLNGSGASRKTTRPTRIVSSAARRRMARAQRARWARARSNNVAPISAKRGKHTISAAGRKRIAAAARARWAKFRAAKKNA